MDFPKQSFECPVVIYMGKNRTFEKSDILNRRTFLKNQLPVGSD